ncbi:MULTISPECIES: MarR family winged helix-turn-helix transcriptional regulator [Enterococcus]|uniref:HTH marR-type domain-containing protein n=1 Tax=Candidatus Enterococcus murrayae TaxID=2815321 RepID=A0ABS3HPX5_9ENTE|nr:MarR family transcriptional regulator [Enterococcus sp. MJM16]MBO0454653.1 hypothetical protein [Enterococcus sp. MJM16]
MNNAKEIRFLFHATLNSRDELYRMAGKAFGLSECTFWILYYMRQSEEKVTQKAVSSFIHRPKQTVHSALKNMIKSGLIELGDYNGKRHKYITLTTKGVAVAEQTVDLVLAEETAAFEDMDSKERELLLSSLVNYSNNLTTRMSKFRNAKEVSESLMINLQEDFSL